MDRSFYRGKEVNELPPEAREETSKRVGLVVSRYFAAHPEEYEQYLKNKEKRKKEAVAV